MRLDRYVVSSLELHLFFGRIMKEHALFLRAGFTPAEPALAEKAVFYLKEFEALLSEAVRLGDGIVRKEVLDSGEVVTEFTALAEGQTERLTSIPIDQDITGRALCMEAGKCPNHYSPQLRCKIRRLNRTALKLLDGLIELKETILRRVAQGDVFTTGYPLLIEHILREAKLYRQYLEILEREGDLPEKTLRETEGFWNQIMMEHALFIRGLLDPCEEALIEAADDFSKEYCRLLEAGRKAHGKTIAGASLEQTRKFRDFKAAGTEGIQQNRIRSVILPLLADHVLREANHYIRLLQK